MVKRRACVVVLGDIGRSPRMQYHSLSLAKQGFFEVDIVAYGDSDPHASILDHPAVHLHTMKQWFPSCSSSPQIFYFLILLLKPLVQFIVLLYYLCFRIQSPDIVLVQNPPSIPTLIAAKWVCQLRTSSFVIDWHNFGYTLLRLSLGRSTFLVAVYRWLERHYGSLADGSLCVTEAMQHELDTKWGIKATVLYDRPPDFFHIASPDERQELFSRLCDSMTHPDGVCDFSGFATDSQRVDPSDTLLASKRQALVVSSTSWTPDEDFGILLEAACIYDRQISKLLQSGNLANHEEETREISNGSHFHPNLVFIITGKGPQKQMYEEKIRELQLQHVSFHTMWLSAEDYPLLLGSADLGVCLHTSSSGLDLPMKIVDMFGCGLPVCAVDYPCVKELVEVEKNGLLFSSASELAEQLVVLFKGYPSECSKLKSLQHGALESSRRRWDSEWEEHALPLFLKASKPHLL